MKASIVDLRYKMRDVLEALDRNEEVTVYHRGKARGILAPIVPSSRRKFRVKDHPFFGSDPAGESVPQVIERLRAPRPNAL